MTFALGPVIQIETFEEMPAIQYHADATVRLEQWVLLLNMLEKRGLLVYWKARLKTEEEDQKNQDAPIMLLCRDHDSFLQENPDSILLSGANTQVDQLLEWIASDFEEIQRLYCCRLYTKISLSVLGALILGAGFLYVYLVSLVDADERTEEGSWPSVSIATIPFIMFGVLTAQVAQLHARSNNQDDLPDHQMKLFTCLQFNLALEYGVAWLLHQLLGVSIGLSLLSSLGLLLYADSFFHFKCAHFIVQFISRCHADFHCFSNQSPQSSVRDLSWLSARIGFFESEQKESKASSGLLGCFSWEVDPELTASFLEKK